MSLITKPNTFSAGATIIASEHNSNFDTIYNDYNGNITNANLSNNAAITGTKVDMSSPGIIGGTTPNAATFSTLKVGTTHQGDVLYDNGTSFVRLVSAVATTGLPLVSLGTGNNPSFVALNSTGVSGIFGAWATGNTATNNLAATDLFVIAFANLAPTNEIIGYTDSSNPPTTKRAAQQAESGGGTYDETIFFPVRKGDYWKVTGATTVYYLPIGT